MSSDDQKSQPLEDWAGCDLENAGAFEVMRTYNGILVRGRFDYSRDMPSPASQSLVFQNPEHFWDWFNCWLSKTKDPRT